MTAPPLPYHDALAYHTHHPASYALAPPGMSINMNMDRSYDRSHHHYAPRDTYHIPGPSQIYPPAHYRGSQSAYHSDSDDHEGIGMDGGHGRDGGHGTHGRARREGRDGRDGSDHSDRLPFADAGNHADDGDIDIDGDGDNDSDPSRKRKRDNYKRTANLRPAEDYRQPPLQPVSDFQQTATYFACHKWLDDRKGHKTKAARKELLIRERITDSLDDRTTLWASVVDSNVDNGACDGCRKGGIECMVPMGTADEERRVVQSVCIMCKVKRRSCDLCHSVSAKRKPNLPPTPNTAPTSSLPGLTPRGPPLSYGAMPFRPPRQPMMIPGQGHSIDRSRAYAPDSYRQQDHYQHHAAYRQTPIEQITYVPPPSATLSRLLLHAQRPAAPLVIPESGKLSPAAAVTVREAMEGIVSRLEDITARTTHGPGRGEKGDAQGHLDYLLQRACETLRAGNENDDNDETKRAVNTYNDTQRMMGDVMSAMVNHEDGAGRSQITGLGYLMVGVQGQMDRWRDALMSALAPVSAATASEV